MNLNIDKGIFGDAEIESLNVSAYGCFIEGEMDIFKPFSMCRFETNALLDVRIRFVGRELVN